MEPTGQPELSEDGSNTILSDIEFDVEVRRPLTRFRWLVPFVSGEERLWLVVLNQRPFGVTAGGCLKQQVGMLWLFRDGLGEMGRTIRVRRQHGRVARRVPERAVSRLAKLSAALKTVSNLGEKGVGIAEGLSSSGWEESVDETRNWDEFRNYAIANGKTGCSR